MKPDLLQFEREYAARVKVVKIDVTRTGEPDYKNYIDLYKSRYIPHLVLINKDRKVLKTRTGSMTKKELVEFTGK
jgi:thiol-disulfide isomerase/thioredoxin